MATDAERKLACQVMDKLVRNTRKIGYRQYRPMVTRNINTMAELDRLIAKGFSMDCSESVTLICHIAKMGDPNHLGFNGYGYTGTILNYCKPHYTDPSKANIGALVVCGPGSGDHVMMVRVPGKDPLLFSHGGEYDPKFVRWSRIVPYLRRPATICSINKL